MLNFYFDLGESIPNVTDWIQACTAIGVLALTAVMACFAKRALNTWKDQKQFDIVISAKANLSNCIFVISKVCFTRDETSNYVLENPRFLELRDMESNDKLFSLKFQLVVYEFSRKKYYNELKDVLSVIRIASVGLEDVELKGGYNDLLDMYNKTINRMTKLSAFLHFVSDFRAANNGGVSKEIDVSIDEYWNELRDEIYLNFFNELSDRATFLNETE